MKRALAPIAVPALVCLVALSCGVESQQDPVYGTLEGGLNAYCTANVVGKGNKAVETDYLPRVIRCENGSAPLEALKAQAVAARSYLYYKLNTSGSVADGTSDQVYTCSAQPSAIHYQAVNETLGEVLRYSNTQVAAFYVAGSVPTAASCVAKAGDNDYSNTEKYVTYNQGKSGNGIKQTTLGWVNTGNYANRGCKSQNGASCLAKAGWNYKDILKFYYGSDIQLVKATGSCVTQCECTAGAKENQACGDCGNKTRTCGSDCQWGGWSGCSGEGPCKPGQNQKDACGKCGERTRSCTGQCAWGGWSDCGGQGACSPGATEGDGCGLCGSRSRTCSGSCAWNGWSGCGGEGVCAPGTTDQSACGECGISTRTCAASCAWGGPSACKSVNPAQVTPCDTSVPGVCATGHIQCLGTFISCVADGAPGDEMCNGLDDDCNGLVDDDATELADPPPELAATHVSTNVPAELVAGAAGPASIQFRNDGTSTWEAGTVRLAAEGPTLGSSSALFDESWEGVFFVVRNVAAVPPGGLATFAFIAHAPISAGEPAASRFWLVHDLGTIRCPDATATATVTFVEPLPVSDGVDSVDGADVSDGVDADGADADGADTDGADADGAATDGSDGGPGDVADATDSSGPGSDATDGGPVDATDGGPDAADAVDGQDAVDAVDGQDGTDGVNPDGTDGVNVDAADARDGADSAPSDASDSADSSGDAGADASDSGSANLPDVGGFRSDVSAGSEGSNSGGSDSGCTTTSTGRPAVWTLLMFCLAALSLRRRGGRS